MTRPQTQLRRQLLRHVHGITLATSLLVTGGFAIADDVKIGNLWIPGVTVDSIADGQVLYYTATGEQVRRPLTQLHGVKITRYSRLAEGQDALDKGDFSAAAAALQRVRGEVIEPWLQQWIDAQLVRAYDESARPVEAVRTFITLAEDEAHATLLAHIPTKSLATATDAQKEQVLSLLTGAQSSIRDRQVRASIDRLIAMSQPAQESPGAETPQGSTGTRPTSTTPTAPGAKPQRVVLPKILLDEPDDITRLLMAGEYEQASQTLNQQITGNTAGRIYKLLYQRGLAQLALAEEKNDRALYLDAGLNFMRVVIYSPRSVYAGPSLLEAGYVHHKIGRNDLAAKLYNNAENLINTEEDAPLAARLEQLKEKLSQ